MLYNINNMPLKPSIREEIKQYIVNAIEKHPRDLVRIASDYFNVSGQTIRNHIKKLIDDEIIIARGEKRGTSYALKNHEKQIVCQVNGELDESEIWQNAIVPFIPKIKENVHFICNYGFTEMLNNIKDHSQSEIAYIQVTYDALRITFVLIDEGIGIFKKIQQDFNLATKNDAILELAKGKLTSDPEHHTGEGIFFTSRLFDQFSIMSENLYFYGHDNDDWLLEVEGHGKGTGVFMVMRRNSNLDPTEVFDRFASPELDDFGFSKTHLPVRLLQHEGEALVSRSQAKRLILRFGQFKEIILDFAGITRIGQGFADEIFRVFRIRHPHVNIIPINLSESVEQTINHVLSSPQIRLF
jgi:STAS-like domain of unknown function (DUF4325)